MRKRRTMDNSLLLRMEHTKLTTEESQHGFDTGIDREGGREGSSSRGTSPRMGSMGQRIRKGVNRAFSPASKEGGGVNNSNNDATTSLSSQSDRDVDEDEEEEIDLRNVVNIKSSSDSILDSIGL